MAGEPTRRRVARYLDSKVPKNGAYAFTAAQMAKDLNMLTGEAGRLLLGIEPYGFKIKHKPIHTARGCLWVITRSVENKTKDLYV